jgi:hypothetical protein
VSDTDGVHVTTWVALPPADAFAVFTDEVDAWWRRGPRFRFGDGAASTMRFEPHAGGRLLETVDATGLTREHGRIRTWAPGERVVWVVDDPRFGVPIEVEVRFEDEAGGTRVAVTQRGLEAVAPDAVARHGLQGEAFLALMGLRWADLLFAHRRRCARHPGVARR